jgi:biofilm PGA synthesis N-glycosyltransferase PgaC
VSGVAGLIITAGIAAVAYVHVGYPALVWLIGRWRRHTVRDAPITPTVAFIISAHDEASIIGPKILNTFSLDYPPERLQVIVACDGSTDSTAARARDAAGGRALVLDEPERRGKGSAMNRAVEHTTADLVVFSDANAMYQRGALRALVSALADPDVGMASGLKTVTRDPDGVSAGETVYWSFEAFLRQAETATGSTVAVVGEILAMRRSLYAPIPASVISDDVYLCMRVLRTDFRVVFVPNAISVEGASASVMDEIVRRRRITASRFQLLSSPGLWPWHRPFVLFELVSHKFMRLAVPWFLIVILVASVVGILRGAGPVLWTVTLLQLVGYTLAGLGTAGWAPPPFKRPAKVAAFVLAGHAASLAGLWDCLTRRATPIWERANRQTTGETLR